MFITLTPVLMAGNSNQYSLKNVVPRLALAAIPMISPVPIQEVQLLDYAVAHKTVNSSYGLTASVNEYDIYLGLMNGDPYTSYEQKQRDLYEINETDWQEVTFEQVSGSSICKLALHQDWITQHHYAVDAVVNMNLPEQGISGPFRITSIKHILPQKKLESNPGDDYEWKPVTGLFIHHSDQVHNVSFDNNETLGVTASHPIYSTTYNDWRLAGELEVGEKVLTYHGEATVTKTEKKAGSEAVYNLEVKDLHNFLVGDVGVVVHNSCWIAYMESFFEKFTKRADPDNDWVDFIVESKPGSLKERQQLSRLGAHEQKRMTVLTKDKTGQDFPGIDGLSDDGRPISLKEVISSNPGQLKDKIKEIGEKAINAKNNSLPQLVDIDGMVTANNFTKAQIKSAIDQARIELSDMSIVKKIFIEGSDGSEWY